ncbi:hypothetical protein FA95DRAFT_723429 [Auriscalpium vulgare]|uniref:Uncharacterized protein n=1 Tax=Auriscalpium vulgare TaxID=40419 RepID=A0ACB8SBD9_9AGAM|nr:hypothetical protein FA95DRAFT_723429 [Auriscalpium vulgare]
MNLRWSRPLPKPPSKTPRRNARQWRRMYLAQVWIPTNSSSSILLMGNGHFFVTSRSRTSRKCCTWVRVRCARRLYNLGSSSTTTERTSVIHISAEGALMSCEEAQTDRLRISWDTRVPTRWRGFFAELALYKSSSYLLPLQGKVVPHLMGLYASPGRVTLAFEPPHDVFWIEASPQMPTVLKKLAIDAFEQLHRQGILHGDVALRHILIDADCRVTLIDFQESFADLPNEDIGIKPIPPGEKEMEMRKVKFFLDYDGARDREIRKTSQAKKRRIANSVLAELRQKQELMNLPPTHIEAIPTPEEDIEEAPVFADVLEEEWMRGMDCMPCRIDMPGVSPVTRALAIEKFMLRIRELEAAAMPAHERHDAFSRRWSVDAEVGSTGSPLSPRSIIGFLFGDPAEDDGAEIDNFKPAPMPMVDLDLWRNNAVSAVAPLQTPLPSPQTRKPAGKRRHQEDFEEDEGRTKKVKLENRPADSLGTFLRRNPSVVESQPTTSSSHLAAAPQINEASPPHQSDKRRSSAPSPAEFRLSSKDPESAAPPFQTPESGPSEVLQPKRRRPNDDGAATEASPTKKPRVASRSKSKAEVESTACPKGSAAIPSGLLSENKTEDLYANVEKPAPRRSKRLQRRSI